MVPNAGMYNPGISLLRSPNRPPKVELQQTERHAAVRGRPLKDRTEMPSRSG
jgi:hypothetical protein